MKSVKEFYDEKVAKIDWFSNCGETTNITTNINLLYVNRWKDMEKKLNSNWDNLKLQIRNSLTSSLHENWREEYREWNNITMEAKSILNNGVLKKLSTHVQENKLGNSVYESIEWDLLCAMMEYAYSPYVEPGFHSELIKVYESGHIPCGWKDTWSQGSLLIF